MNLETKLLILNAALLLADMKNMDIDEPTENNIDKWFEDYVRIIKNIEGECS